jgi:hypothetical protein
MTAAAAMSGRISPPTNPPALCSAPLGTRPRGARQQSLLATPSFALEGETGKLKWFQQIVHHDAADYDMPTPAHSD